MKQLFILMVLLFLGCGPDPIPAPKPSVLILPDNLNTCNTASRVNDFESQVRFQWTAALDTESYQLVIENTLTRQKRTVSTSLLSESVRLSSGAPYSWYVVSKSLLTDAVGQSSVWQFYLEGNPEASHFPFPAQLLEPQNKAELGLDDSNSLLFQWNGNDLDGDIESYELYLGESTDELSKEREGLTNNQTEIQLLANTLYFWQVVSIDREGNHSYSEIFQFQTL